MKFFVQWIMVAALAAPLLAQEIPKVRNTSDGTWFLVPLFGSGRITLRTGADLEHLGPAVALQVTAAHDPLALPPRSVTVFDRFEPDGGAPAIGFGVYDSKMANSDGLTATFMSRTDGQAGLTLVLERLKPRPGQPAGQWKAGNLDLDSPCYPEPAAAAQPSAAATPSRGAALQTSLASNSFTPTQFLNLSVTPPGFSAAGAGPTGATPRAAAAGTPANFGGRDLLEALGRAWAAEGEPTAKRQRAVPAAAAATPHGGPWAAPAPPPAIPLPPAASFPPALGLSAPERLQPIHPGDAPGVVITNQSQNPVSLSLFQALMGLRARILRADGTGEPSRMLSKWPTATLGIEPGTRLLLIPPPGLDALGLTFDLLYSTPGGALENVMVHWGRRTESGAPRWFLNVFSPSGAMAGPELLPQGVRWDGGSAIEILP